MSPQTQAGKAVEEAWLFDRCKMAYMLAQVQATVRGPAARGGSSAPFERRCIPRGLRCSSVEYGQYASSSRLATRALRRSRCDVGFHHGLPAVSTPGLQRERNKPRESCEVRLDAVPSSSARHRGVSPRRFLQRDVHELSEARHPIQLPAGRAAGAPLRVRTGHARRRPPSMAWTFTGSLAHQWRGRFRRSLAGIPHQHAATGGRDTWPAVCADDGCN